LLLRRRPLACQDVIELVTAYLDDALPKRERARLESHLRGCPHCTEYLRQIRETRRMLGTVELDGLAPAARNELLDVFRRWSNDEDQEHPDR
jgi:anti-sigma factor RsiW